MRQPIDDPRLWVLVAGTGLPKHVSRAAKLAAEEVGAMVAGSQFGLITGGWPGVDALAMESFISHCQLAGLDADRRLVQFGTDDRDIYVHAGQIIRVERGAEDWLGPQNYANAVVMIGGIGGAYTVFLGALHSGLPRP